jgi:hypothetical protein
MYVLNVCLSSNFLFKLTYLTRKQNHALLCRIVTLKVPSFIAMCYQWMHAFSAEFWSLRLEPLWDSFLNFCISLAFLTSNKMKVTWCQDPTQPYCSHLYGSVSNIHHAALTWHQVTFIFLVLWSSVLVVTDSKMLFWIKSCRMSKCWLWIHNFWSIYISGDAHFIQLIYLLISPSCLLCTGNLCFIPQLCSWEIGHK